MGSPNWLWRLNKNPPNWEPEADYEIEAKQPPEALQRIGDILWSSSTMGTPGALTSPYQDPDANPQPHTSQPFRRRSLRDPDDQISNDEEDAEGNPKTFKRVCVRFAERTSMQGVPYIYVSRVWYAKLLWTFLFVAGFGAMIFHLVYLSLIFFEYKSSTTVELGFNTLDFPAVTVCNVNAVKSSKMYLASSRLSDLVAQVQPANIVKGMEDKRLEGQVVPTDPPSKAIGRRKRSLSEVVEEHRRVKRFIEGFELDGSETEAKKKPAYSRRGDKEVFSGNKSQIRVIEDEFKYQFSILPRHTREEMGHHIDDMLMECTFRGVQCSSDQFVQMQTADYGNCFTMDDPRFISTLGGPSDGLTLIIFLEDSEYLSGITSSLGMQVHIHAPGAFPNPYEECVSIPGGMETSIGLKQINIVREDWPYGDCVSGADFKEKYNITYTQKVCQQFCVQRNVMSTCNCFDAEYDEIHKKLLGDNATRWEPCRGNNTECLQDVQSDFRDGGLDCDCKSPCSETVYEKSLSSKVWPTTEYATILVEYLCAALNETVCGEYAHRPRSELASAFLKLTIYFQDLNYENITEQPDYEAFQFASDVGGTIGLWIGLSLISFFEVLQFAYEVFHFLCYVRPKQAKKEHRRKKLRQQKRTARHAIQFVNNLMPEGPMQTPDAKIMPASPSTHSKNDTPVHNNNNNNTSTGHKDDNNLLSPHILGHSRHPSNGSDKQRSPMPSRKSSFSEKDSAPNQHIHHFLNGGGNFPMPKNGPSDLHLRNVVNGYANFGIRDSPSAYPSGLKENSTLSLDDVQIKNPYI